jgi:hypothetical protein
MKMEGKKGERVPKVWHVGEKAHDKKKSGKKKRRNKKRKKMFKWITYARVKMRCELNWKLGEIITNT